MKRKEGWAGQEREGREGGGITMEERERERERTGSVEVNLCLNRETDRGDNRKTFGSLSKDYLPWKERGKEGRKDICGGLSLFPSNP